MLPLIEVGVIRPHRSAWKSGSGFWARKIVWFGREIRVCFARTNPSHTWFGCSILRTPVAIFLSDNFFNVGKLTLPSLEYHIQFSSSFVAKRHVALPVLNGVFYNRFVDLGTLKSRSLFLSYNIKLDPSIMTRLPSSVICPRIMMLFWGLECSILHLEVFGCYFCNRIKSTLFQNRNSRTVANLAWLVTFPSSSWNFEQSPIIWLLAPLSRYHTLELTRLSLKQED